MSVGKKPLTTQAASRVLRLARAQSVLRARDVATQGVHTSTLTRLTRSGAVEKVGPGRYRLAKEQPRTEHHDLRRRVSDPSLSRLSPQEVEARVLSALQDKLMRKDFFEEFCREFAKKMNRLRMEQRAGLTSAKREVERIGRRIKKLLDLLLDDEIDMDEGKAEMKALDARRKELEGQLKAADEPPPLLHPSMADLDRSKVEELAAALQREDTRLEASEMLRGLIEAIVLTPEKGQLRIDLKGNLAAMLAAAQQTKRSPETGDLHVPIQLVAGARPRLRRRLCWTAA